MKLVSLIAALLTLGVGVADPDGATGARADVVTACWGIGIPFARFDRCEWYDPATGATRRSDAGGPSCVRHTVVNARRIGTFGCWTRRVVRARDARDPRLIWQTSDLLRPRRLLALGRAQVVGPVVTKDGRQAVRVHLPISRKYGEGPPEALHYAHLDPRTLLPLEFAFELDGQMHTYVPSIRHIRRSSLPRRFFST